MKAKGPLAKDFGERSLPIKNGPRHPPLSALVRDEPPSVGPNRQRARRCTRTPSTRIRAFDIPGTGSAVNAPET